MNPDRAAEKLIGQSDLICGSNSTHPPKKSWREQAFSSEMSLAARGMLAIFKASILLRERSGGVDLCVCTTCSV